MHKTRHIYIYNVRSPISKDIIFIREKECHYENRKKLHHHSSTGMEYTLQIELVTRISKLQSHVCVPKCIILLCKKECQLENMK